MTIRQHGGIFGRNPTFNSITVNGILTVDQIVEKTGADRVGVKTGEFTASDDINIRLGREDKDRH